MMTLLRRALVPLFVVGAMLLTAIPSAGASHILWGYPNLYGPGPGAAPTVGVLVTAHGAWRFAEADGSVITTGSFYGSASGMKLDEPIVGIAGTPSGNGYWLVASDGGIFSFGDARFFGSTGGLRLNAPIVGMAPTPSGNGYWLVASDGGVFSFGDAPFLGSAGGLKLVKPVVGMAANRSTPGYWLVASDGGVFNYGAAPFFGSAGGIKLNKPIVGIASTYHGDGYWLAGADGGIFTYGIARIDPLSQDPSQALPGGLIPPAPVVGITATSNSDFDNYVMVARNGTAFPWSER